MNLEIERKFLVLDDRFKKEAVRSVRIRQGYIAHDSGRTVRVRIAGDKGYLTIKGPSLDGISRQEWEREIPLQDAEDLFPLCKPGAIDKTRYIIPVPDTGRKWEVDEFYGNNEGLVMAEIELGAPEEPFDKPDWLGEEVTGDRRYYNAQLCLNPYKNWK
ncbi:MAG: CYTH domain-containing protein [Bacteroidales bacterium]|nr:CYTH domain-containing protein [Bacteroidales bacterium]